MVGGECLRPLLVARGHFLALIDKSLPARLSANAFTTGRFPKVVHVFSARVSVMCLAPNLIEAPSAIDLPEHDVERADDCRDIGQHMPAAQEIHRLQMGERRRPDLALVRPVAAVRHQVDAELALGRLDRGIDLAGGT
jgi:hypothetical protein